MIIAIDGPAGSGKSTIAREVAKRLGLRYLDTGAMYRTVTLLALEAGLVPGRIAQAGALAAATPLRLKERADDLTQVFVGDREVTDEIRGRVVSQNVSAVSADPGVRAVLTGKQREEAGKGGVVVEGRDIGTVVFPDADVKVFLTATAEERARRRQLQLEAKGVTQPLDELIADMTARDAYDSERELSPLRKADDALEIDTTNMTIGQVVDAVCGLAAPRKWPLSRMVRGPLDNWLYRFAYSFIPAATRLLFRVQINGLEHFPTRGAVLLACNHRSNLDPFFIGVACPRQIHFMAKAELFSFKPLGWLVGKLGSFPVSRGEVDREAVKQALAYLAAGSVLGLFPEGRRQRKDDLGEIRPGASLFSLRDGVTTIPVIMEGTERVVEHGLVRFPRVRVTFGPALQVPDKALPHSERARLTTERLVEAYRMLFSTRREGS